MDTAMPTAPAQASLPLPVPVDGANEAQTLQQQSQQPVKASTQTTTNSTGSKRALRQQGRVDYQEVVREVDTDTESDDDDPAPKRHRLATAGQVLLCIFVHMMTSRSLLGCGQANQTQQAT